MSISTQSAALILTIPFIGTTLGSACVFLMRGALSRRLEHFLLGFASGVMTAAAVWSSRFSRRSISRRQRGWESLPPYLPA